MSPRLETITGRIGGALGRIDGALQDRLPEVDERVKELATELAASRRENTELSSANTSVAARLDLAIERLRTVLRN